MLGGERIRRRRDELPVDRRVEVEVRKPRGDLAEPLPGHRNLHIVMIAAVAPETGQAPSQPQHTRAPTSQALGNHLGRPRRPRIMSGTTTMTLPVRSFPGGARVAGGGKTGWRKKRRRRRKGSGGPRRGGGRRASLSRRDRSGARPAPACRLQRVASGLADVVGRCFRHRCGIWLGGWLAWDRRPAGGSAADGLPVAWGNSGIAAVTVRHGRQPRDRPDRPPLAEAHSWSTQVGEAGRSAPRIRAGSRGSRPARW